MDQGRDMTDATAAPGHVVPVAADIAHVGRDLVVGIDLDHDPSRRPARSPPRPGRLAGTLAPVQVRSDPRVRNDELVRLSASTRQKTGPQRHKAHQLHPVHFGHLGLEPQDTITFMEAPHDSDHLL